MPNEEHFRKLERAYSTARINRYYEPELHVEEGRSRLTIEVREEFFHAADAVHGSVYFKALDDAAFFAVNSVVEDVFVLTNSFNIYLLRPVSRGKLTATGRMVHESKRWFVGESELVDSDGRLLARGGGTFMRSQIPLTPEIGYE